MKSRKITVGGGLTLLAAASLTLTNCGNNMTIKTLPYPDTRIDNVADNYHGTIVSDPYRWLEDDNSAETAEWVKAQNVVTQDYLSQIPYRAKVKNRLTELNNYSKEGVPYKKGEWYYFSKNDGLQNQSVLYRQRSLDGEAEVFIDPNTLSADGTVAMGEVSFSENSKYCAYTVAASGSDWVEIRLMDTETKQALPDLIEWVKFSGANWDAASEGFYYSRYDEPTKGSELSGQNRFQKIYYHKLGQEQSQDKLIYWDEKHPLRYFHGQESEDGKYLFVTASDGTHGNEILVRETARPNAQFRVLLPGFKYDYSVVYCKDDMAYVYTNNGNTNFQLIRIDMKARNPRPEAVVGSDTNYLEGVSFVGGYIMATYLENATSIVYQYDMTGKLVRKAEVPGIGTTTGFGGKEEDTETFYAFTSFTAPAAVYKYTLADGKSELLRQPELRFDPELYTTDQVFFESKDGTRVPMFIVHRKDMQPDGQNPTHIYGYGGFSKALTPSFNPNNIMFLEQGGIYVLVSLRGGNEYGEKWHRSGMLESKQNVFDDFIGAAEYLIEKNYTNSSKIAISGASNGGLLVGACMTQRPDLYAVAIPQVGVLDMLRYHEFTVGWGWAAEYGRSDNPEQFEYLYKYSPLHNIKEGTCYPATMVMTADHDDRVVPAHSFKFAAALQKAQACDKPALIRIDVNAGHGAGKPTSKRIEDAADMYSFIFWNTGTEVKF